MAVPGGAGFVCVPAAWGLSLAIAAATASFACRAASSIAAWDGAGFPGLPFVDGASVAVATGGVKDFWLTVNGTAGVTRLLLGPAGTGLAGACAAGAGAAPAGGAFAAISARVGLDCVGAAAGAVVLLGGGAAGDCGLGA